MDAGLLPVRSPRRAKSRLSARYKDPQRELLARALLADALDLCHACDFLRWWVISDDPEVLDDARARGLGTVTDAGLDLNDALEGGVAAATAEGAASIVVVPADVPLAQPVDLIDLLDTGATSDVVLVPSRAGGGTNGLYLSPPGALEPRFGPSSLTAYLAAAEARGLRCAILALVRLGADVDTPEDLDEIAPRLDPGSHTAVALTAMAGLRDGIG